MQSLSLCLHSIYAKTHKPFPKFVIFIVILPVKSQKLIKFAFCHMECADMVIILHWYENSINDRDGKEDSFIGYGLRATH